MQPVMDEYGIDLVNFYVNEISVPEDDSAVKKLKDALSKRAEMNIIGYSYQQERSFDTLEGAAKNPGSSSTLMGAGMGLGMGVGMGKSVGRGFSGIAQEIQTSAPDAATNECPKCHAQIPAGQRFCGSCGFDTSSATTSVKIKTTCSSCGKTIIGSTKFCPDCGRKLNLCPECGNDIPDDAAKCPSCGYAAPMICPDCGAKIPATSKFCPECGHSFTKKCPECGEPLQGTPKFCPECGHRF